MSMILTWHLVFTDFDFPKQEQSSFYGILALTSFWICSGFKIDA